MEVLLKFRNLFRSSVWKKINLYLLCTGCLYTMKTQANELHEPKIEFIENAGQWEKEVLYKADLAGGWLFLEQDQLTYLFLESHTHGHGVGAHNNKQHLHHDETKIKGHTYRSKWIGSNKYTEIQAEQSYDHHLNYFLGNEQKKWKSKVTPWKNVVYRNIYDHIDFKIYSHGSTLKSDYIVRQGGDPSQIKVEYDGVSSIKIDKTGRLHISTSVNEVYEFAPYSYQYIHGELKEIKSAYALTSNQLSFVFPEGYDTSEVLIIDPTLVFSTYSGSISDNWGASSTHDSKGNMYLGGISRGVSYPVTVGAFQTTYGGASSSGTSVGCDVVITKFTADGTKQLYSTFLGGRSNELLSSLYSTGKDELILLMATSSNDFPIGSHPYQSQFRGGSNVTMMGSIIFPNGSDIAVVKLSEDGTALIGGTYYGGTANDGLNLGAQLNYNYGDESRGDIAVDKNGNIYIVSSTTSTNLTGTARSLQPTRRGDYDGLLVKFNENLSQIHWATYYGGLSADAAYSIQLDSEENIYISGGTRSNSLPGTANGLNATYRGGLADGYIAKISNDGTQVLAATYLGTSQHDQAHIIDLDKDDNVYVFGQSLGSYPVSSGVYSNPGSKQFIHKLSPDLRTTIFSTVFGRPNYQYINISPTAFMVDVCENIYAVGWGGESNQNINRLIGYTNGMPVTPDAFMTTTDGSDFYLINLSKDAQSLIYASYFGEPGANDHVDGGTSRFDKNGIVYQSVCASCSGRNGFPVTPDAYGTSNLSINCNMAGFKFRFNIEAMQIIQIDAQPDKNCLPLTKSFSYTSTQPGTIFSWEFGDGESSQQQFPSHTYQEPGTYQVKFTLINPDNCNPIDSAFLTVNISADTFGIKKELCAGSIFELDGKQFDKDGLYKIVYQDQYGCDSTVHLHLSFLSVIKTELAVEICHGNTYPFHGNILSTSGIYTEKLQSASGCDSIIQLTLNILPQIYEEKTVSICKNNKYVVGENSYTLPGTYTDILTAISGCDSVIVTHLSITYTLEENIDISLCEGTVYEWNGIQYHLSGSYTQKLTASSGCDSIVTVHLQHIPEKRTESTVTICAGDSYTIGTNTYTESGIYTDILATGSGCDSVVITHLHITNIIESNLDVNICEGDVYEWGEVSYSFPGNYSRTFQTTAGCDSIVHLTLAHLPIQKTELSETICSGDFYTIGDTIYTESGTYFNTFLSASGCDSIVALHLTVLQYPEINLGNDTSACPPLLLTAGNSEWEYLWQDGSDEPYFTITESGIYKVSVTNDCGTDTDSIHVEILSACYCEVLFPGAFTPNNDGINDRFGAIEQGAAQTMLKIYNRWGELVFESADSNIRWNGQLKGKDAPMDTYIYYYEGLCENGKAVQKKGNILLIR